MDETKYNRACSNSLYSIGYTDGYQSAKHNPRYRLVENDSITGGVFVTDVFTTADDEVREYTQGYDDGKFHLNIDTKK